MAILTKKNTISLSNLDVNKCLEHGLHYGSHKKNWDTRMNNYIYGHRNNLHIIDLEKSIVTLKKSLNVITDTIAKGGKILFFSSDKKYNNIVYNTATSSNQMCILNRWVNGTLTNFKLIKPYYLKRYTNNNVINTNKHFLEADSLPSLIFLPKVKHNENIIAEANKLHIPIISIVDTNSNPTNITYPIPGNSDSIESIYLYNKLIFNSIIKGQALSE